MHSCGRKTTDKLDKEIKHAGKFHFLRIKAEQYLNIHLANCFYFIWRVLKFLMTEYVIKFEKEFQTHGYNQKQIKMTNRFIRMSILLLQSKTDFSTQREIFVLFLNQTT